MDVLYRLSYKGLTDKRGFKRSEKIAGSIPCVKGMGTQRTEYTTFRRSFFLLEQGILLSPEEACGKMQKKSRTDSSHISA